MSSLVPLLLGATALASTVNVSPWTVSDGYHRFAPRTEGFNWTSCGADASRECSSFEVPLDWADHSAGKATLAVARYKATKQPKLGTLFMNPGGPGGSGVKLIMNLSDRILEAVGGQYDIISWDPRGVGLSVPRVECFKTLIEEDTFWEGTIPRAGLEARGNFTDLRDLDEFYGQVGKVDVLLESLGKRCVDYSPDTLQYIGTAAGVRDMVAMHDVLEGSDKPVNYWGLSYGTVIGIYFVNMFPDRVGRVVIDGVVDPEYWANRPAHEMWWIKPESTDEAVTGFVTACAAAGPSGCALAAKNSTSDSIRQQIRDVLDAIYDYRRAAGPSALTNSASIRAQIYGAMYKPADWPKLADQLATLAAVIHNISSISNSTNTRSVHTLPVFDISRQQVPTNETTSSNSSEYNARVEYYARIGVTCGDAIDPGSTTTKDVFDFLVKVTREVSQMFGPLWVDGGLYCHRWPVQAVERYTGPWNKKLANPILVIGTEADPVTPLISAKKVADALGDSAVLIEQDDYGVSKMHSTCTISALQDYFVNNKLPSQDKLCGTDQVLFPGPGITKNTLAKSTSQNLSTSSNSELLQEELDKMRARGKILLIAVVALVIASVLLVVCIIFSCIRGRRKSKAARVTYIPRGAFERGRDEQGHVYDDPVMKRAGDKLGVYSRVDT